MVPAASDTAIVRPGNREAAQTLNDLARRVDMATDGDDMLEMLSKSLASALQPRSCRAGLAEVAPSGVPSSVVTSGVGRSAGSAPTMPAGPVQ